MFIIYKCLYFYKNVRLETNQFTSIDCTSSFVSNYKHYCSVLFVLWFCYYDYDQASSGSHFCKVCKIFMNIHVASRQMTDQIFQRLFGRAFSWMAGTTILWRCEGLIFIRLHTAARDHWVLWLEAGDCTVTEASPRDASVPVMWDVLSNSFCACACQALLPLGFVITLDWRWWHLSKLQNTW